MTGINAYLLAVAGAFALYVWGTQKGFRGAEDFINRKMPRAPGGIKTLIDMCLSVVFGAFIGYIVFDPHTPFAALAAGAGWVGAVNTLVTPQAHEGKPPRNGGDAQGPAGVHP